MFRWMLRTVILAAATQCSAGSRADGQESPAMMSELSFVPYESVVAEPGAIPPPEPIFSADAPQPPGEQVSRGPTLDELVGLTLMNHPRLREAAAAIEQARGEAVQAGLYPNPRFESGNPQFQLGGAQSVYSGGFTQEIVRGNKLRLSRAAAEQRVASLQMQFLAERRNVLLELHKQFVIVTAAQQRLVLLAEMRDLAARSEQSSQALLDAGQASRTDVLLLRTERRRAEAAVQALELNVQGQRRRLAALVGLPEMPIEFIEGDLERGLPPLVEAELLRSVLATNPQVRSTQFEIQRTRYAVDRAVAEPIPNVTLQGGAQRTLDPGKTQGLLGVYFDMPLWNRNQGGIRAARAEAGGALAHQGVVRTELVGRLADAVARYRAASETIENYEAGILPDTEEGLNLVREGYNRGQFDILRLLQAQRSFSEARLAWLAAVEERAAAAVEIESLARSETAGRP